MLNGLVSASTLFMISMAIILLYIVFEVFGYSFSSYLTESDVHDQFGQSVTAYIRLQRALYKYMFITTMTVSLFGVFLFYDGYLVTVTSETFMFLVKVMFTAWWGCYIVYMMGVWFNTSSMFYDRYSNTKLGYKTQSFF